MELLVASAIGLLTAAGVYMVLRLRTFPVILGLSLLSYAVNLFLFATGRLAINLPPVLKSHSNIDPAGYTDPLPQALVLTAIVISFGMTAVIVMVSISACLASDTDRVDLTPAPGAGTEAEAGEDQPEDRR